MFWERVLSKKEKKHATRHCFFSSVWDHVIFHRQNYVNDIKFVNNIFESSRLNGEVFFILMTARPT